jgi:hypothetical protein
MFFNKNYTYKIFKFISYKSKSFLYSYFLMWAHKSIKNIKFLETFQKIKSITKVLKINYKRKLKFN